MFSQTYLYSRGVEDIRIYTFPLIFCYHFAFLAQVNKGYGALIARNGKSSSHANSQKVLDLVLCFVVSLSFFHLGQLNDVELHDIKLSTGSGPTCVIRILFPSIHSNIIYCYTQP